MNNLLAELSYATEVVAFLCMCWFAYRHRTRRSLLLVFLLLLVVLGESLNKFQVLPSQATSLVTVNSLVLVEWLCYAVFFQWSISTLKFRRMILIGLGLLGLFAIVNTLFLQSMTATIQTYTYILGALFILGCILLFFHEILLVQEVVVPLHRRYYLWISAGLFLFLAADIPVMMILNYMIEHKISPADWPVMNVKMAASSLYYSTYAVGLLWARTE
ncbi:MAG: hypothetical protein KDB88_09040 [Flavobacteriales bacterium]|nr:hypothetical protein [Flavobacteriales bacterium]